MSSVTFSTTVGGDGSTVTDDDNATTGLGNGGALIRLVPMMQQVVNVAAYTVNAVDSVTGLNDLYLGSYSSNPTLNNSGDALIAGNLYFNDVSDEMRVYTGSAWAAAYIPAGLYLPLAGGTMTGAITFAAGQTVDGTNAIGYKNIPQTGSDKTTAYTLVTGDVGKYVGVGTSGSIVVPNSTFANGDAISVFNNTSGNITLTMSITTAYIGGTDTDKATITLATRGIATILFVSSTVCVVTGNVS
jgi:hypothetical protein